MNRPAVVASLVPLLFAAGLAVADVRDYAAERQLRPMGATIQQTHVLAAGVANRHWVDIHLSIAGKERPDPAQLLERLKAFSLR